MRHLRRWGAVYVLLILFAGSWLAQFITQAMAFTNEQQTLGQEFQWTDFWPEFMSATFENWQSEWLQLVFQAILLMGAQHWIFKVQAEDMERIEAKIDRLQDALGLPTPPPDRDSDWRE